MLCSLNDLQFDYNNGVGSKVDRFSIDLYRADGGSGDCGTYVTSICDKESIGCKDSSELLELEFILYLRHLVQLNVRTLNGSGYTKRYVYFPEYAPTQPFVTDISVMYTRVFPLVFFPLYCCGPNRFLVLGMCVSRQHTDHKQKGNEKGGGNPVNILLRSTFNP